MRTTTKTKTALGLLTGAILAIAALPARAQDYGNQGYYPDSGEDQVQQTVARISYVDGDDASYSRGDAPDTWEAAVVNVPVTLGDRVYTGDRSRMELQVHGGTFVRMAPQTDLTALNLTDDVKQLSLAAGTASFRVRRLRNDEVFEVDTPNVAVTFDTPGNYRVDVDENGYSHVVVRSGHVTVSAAGGEIPISSGNEISIQGFDNPSYDVVGLGRIDSWDRWVSLRDSRFRRVRSYQYVNADVVGVEDLDQYGQWQDVPQYGRCWSPSSVQAGWMPYRDGQWIWQDPWGWTWVGAEPWGWAPYHYGRWVTYSSRWYWVPAGPRVAVSYSPALVAFVGGGPGWSASITIGGGGGYVGWFPLAPRDPFLPWWGSRRDRERQVNITNVTYVNRNYVTVVNQNTFVSGGVVANNYVRDPQIIRQVSAASVMRGPIPVVPTASSLRIAAVASRPAPRPPAKIQQRAVVTRVAPPPAPAPFQTKVRVIQENRGAPVAPRAAAQLSIQAHEGARAAAPVRPASVEGGAVGLTPKRPDAKVRPKAVTAPRGKALATRERPLVANPTAVDSKGAQAPARIAPGAVARPEGAAPRPAAPPAVAAPPPPAPESWRQRVPPGQQKKAAPSERPVTPPRREAPPSAVETTTPPPPAERAAPPETRRVPPGRAAPPPARTTESAPPPARETPPPAPRTTVAPPERRAAPPPRVEGQKPAVRAQPRGKAPEKDKGKDKKKKEEPPPPPPPSL